MEPLPELHPLLLCELGVVHQLVLQLCGGRLLTGLPKGVPYEWAQSVGVALS